MDYYHMDKEDDVNRYLYIMFVKVYDNVENLVSEDFSLVII